MLLIPGLRYTCTQVIHMHWLLYVWLSIHMHAWKQAQQHNNTQSVPHTFIHALKIFELRPGDVSYPRTLHFVFLFIGCYFIFNVRQLFFSLFKDLY